jgi:hypothetical protein
MRICYCFSNPTLWLVSVARERCKTKSSRGADILNKDINVCTNIMGKAVKYNQSQFYTEKLIDQRTANAKETTVTIEPID